MADTNIADTKHSNFKDCIHHRVYLLLTVFVPDVITNTIMSYTSILNKNLCKTCEKVVKWDEPVDMSHLGDECNCKNMLLNDPPDYNRINPLPVYWEKYSSFETTMAPDILKLIWLYFKSKSNVDVSATFMKNKIKGCVCDVFGQCTFKIQLFQSSGKIIVEFQKRYGSIETFFMLYKKCILSIQGIITNHEDRKSIADWIEYKESVSSLYRLPQDATDNKDQL